MQAARLTGIKVWLVLIVVLFSKALTLVYLLMNEDMLVDRQYSHGEIGRASCRERV